MAVHSFEELKTWQACRDLRIWTKALVVTWPVEEKYDLISQIIRSSRSSAANIAEGYGRNNSKDNARFCRIASGSVFETKNHLINAKECEYVDTEQYNEGVQLIDTAIKLINGYIRYLNSDPNLR